ncbi:ADP-ribosyl-[dinitrogen reductase] hydrolase [Paraburkholderia sp. UCT70]|uniref:ADP-ribosylglycohydrolase family protein n=1 Tax=Paraburkholderia sp. UCT70 TaxID=2991068 RepID=UPI003D213669
MTNRNLEHRERIRGGLYGLLVGDALGVPYEFHDATEIPPLHEIEMTPPRGFRRAHAGVPIGTWSDDGAQALCLLASLSRDASLDLDDFGRQLVQWYETGHMTPDTNVFDVGIQTRRALGALQRGVEASQAGPNGERDNGNGALMRCLPVVFAAQSTDDVIDLAMRQGVVTHGHVRSQLCCALYALSAAGILNGLAANEAVGLAESELRRRFAGTENEREAKLVLSARAEPPRGSGYVVDSLWSSIECLLTTTDYESCVRRAVMLGNDTDTTACIAGGLAGLVYEYAGIPTRWREALKGKVIVERLLRESSFVQGFQ